MGLLWGKKISKSSPLTGEGRVRVVSVFCCKVLGLLGLSNVLLKTSDPRLYPPPSQGEDFYIISQRGELIANVIRARSPN